MRLLGRWAWRQNEVKIEEEFMVLYQSYMSFWDKFNVYPVGWRPFSLYVVILCTKQLIHEHHCCLFPISLLKWRYWLLATSSLSWFKKLLVMIISGIWFSAHHFIKFQNDCWWKQTETSIFLKGQNEPYMLRIFLPLFEAVLL